MRELLSLVVSGAVGGALYAIVASGIVLTYQTSGILNFAHGAVAFVTAYFFYILHSSGANGGLGLPVAAAAVISVLLFAPLLGWLLDRVMLRRLSAAPETARVVGTVGLLVAMPAAAIYLVERLNAIFSLNLPSSDQVYNPPGIGPRPKETWSITRGVAIDSDQLVVFATAAVAAVGLWLVLRRTRLGLETRAGVDRGELAALRGVDTDRVGAASWMLSFLLAGLAGVLIAPLFDLAPLTYNLIVFASFTAVVFAGLKSIPLAFAGGLLLGVLQNLVYGYAPGFLTDISGFRSVFPFALLLFFLIVVSGRGGWAATRFEQERRPADHRAGLPAWRRRLPWALASVGLAVYVLFTANDFWASLITQGLALGLIFLSFVVVTGVGGMISLAQPAFVTAGAFATGWLMNHQWSQTTPVLMNNGRVTFLAAILAGAVVAAAVGVLVALPTLRLGGLALALGTLALAFIGDRLVFQIEAVRNGSGGWSISAPKLGSIDFGNPRTMTMLLLALCLLFALGISNLVRSPSGRAVLAVRSTDAAARTAGISPVRAKVGLFALSAGIAGFGGGMYAAVASPFTNTTAPAMVGVIWLAVTVTFGIRRAAGAVLAGLTVALLPSGIDWLTNSTFAWAMMFWLAAGTAAGWLLGVAQLRAIRSPREWLMFAGAGLVLLAAAAISASDTLLAAALVVGGVLLGQFTGEEFADHPRAGSAAAVGAVVGLLALPQVVVWSASTTTAANVVHDAIGSSQVPSILFGLGAIMLAANPNGVLALGGERLKLHRLTSRSAERVEQKLAPVPASHAPVATVVPQQVSVVAPTRITHSKAAVDEGALRIEGLVAGWGDVEVLHGVDLEVPAGQIVALLGANGAGKSTLCQVAAGIGAARGGEIRVLGQDVTGKPAYLRARNGLVLVPEARGIFPGLSVEENLQIWLRDPALRTRAYDRYPILGKRRKQLAGLLSGGEQQMLALSPLIEHPPAVLITDEPSLGLAPTAVRDVYDSLVELREQGTALLLVEERANDALAIADSIVLLSLGRVTWSGARRDTDADQLAAAYLGA